MKSISPADLPFDSHQLNAFVTLVETGSFTETARRLSLTQSAISHSMKVLEAQTHCRLLDRLGNLVVPTEAGEALLHHARAGLKEFGKGRLALDQLKKWGARRLRLGATDAVSQEFLPSILSDLRRQHPKLLVTVKTIILPGDIDNLRQGELDCIVCEEARLGDDLEFIPLFASPLCFVVPNGHRWPPRRKISLAELCREPCLLPAGASPLRAAIDQFLLEHDSPLNCIGEVDSLESMKQLVKADFAIGILPQWTVKNEARAGELRLVMIAAREIRHTWGLLRWRPRRPMDTLECAFRHLCLKAARKMGAAPEGAPLS